MINSYGTPNSAIVGKISVTSVTIEIYTVLLPLFTEMSVMSSNKII